MSRRPFTPHAYQQIAIDHLLEHPRTALWAGMGLGKTISTLNVLDTLSRLDGRPALVLAPLRVAASTWPRECRKWAHLAHLDVKPIIGSQDERRLALRSDAPIYTCNYDNLPWLVEHFGQRWPFTRIVADEATRLKSFRLRQGGARARALGRIAHLPAVETFIELTGTPAPNGLADLWGQLWFLDAGVRLGRSYTSFRQRWFQKSFDGYGTTPLPHADNEIHERLKDICLTIDACDWFDIAQPIRKTLYIDLPAKARQHYREMEKQMFTEIEGEGVEAVHAASRTMKCLQLASGFAWADAQTQKWLSTHDLKLDALESILSEAHGAPVLVEYHWTPMRDKILKAFPQARHLSGDPAIEDAWNAGKIPILVANAASAGHGLNLQDGGHILARIDHWWDLEQYDQILERIGPVRQLQAGHPRPVWDYHIVARDTVDEMVMERRETKRSVQDILLARMKRRAA